MTISLMPVAEALQRLRSEPFPVLTLECVPLTSAVHRVLATDVVSPVDVPPTDNSAVDGYALRYDDWCASEIKSMECSQRIAAGDVPTDLVPNTIARIFTGASVPRGADTVVMQEDVRLRDDGAITIEQLQASANIRAQGQDIRQGQVLFKAGRVLDSADLGVLASVGVDEVEVYRRLRVAVLSTGSELIEPGSEAKPGQLYNSNRYTLNAVLKRWGFDVVDLGIIKDDFHATRASLREAADHADVIVSSGGASVGEEDYIKQALDAEGHLEFWRLAIKPGKPFNFGRINGVPFLGLPGNPVAVFVTLAIIAREFLLRAQGACPQAVTRWPVRAGFDWHRKGLREEYLRVKLKREGDVLLAQAFPNQSSGVLTSVSASCGFVVVPVGATFDQGDLVEYLAFNDLLSPVS